MTAPGIAGRRDGTLAGPDDEVLAFVADMFGLQLDQLAALLANRGEPSGSAAGRAREVVAGWRAAGYADSEELSVGQPWVWASRQGLDACGFRPRLVRPPARLLRHIHAVTDVRLALERTSAYREGGASWSPERQILARLGTPAREEHVPDGEVRWPAGCGLPWAGQTWAVEVELSRKSTERTARIMREALARTGDYGCPPASIAVPGQPPRYARLVYACSPSAVRTVLSARAELGSPMSAHIDVHDLPEQALRLNTPKRGWQS